MLARALSSIVQREWVVYFNPVLLNVQQCRQQCIITFVEITDDNVTAMMTTSTPSNLNEDRASILTAAPRNIIEGSSSLPLSGGVMTADQTGAVYAATDWDESRSGQAYVDGANAKSTDEKIPYGQEIIAIERGRPPHHGRETTPLNDVISGESADTYRGRCKPFLERDVILHYVERTLGRHDSAQNNDTAAIKQEQQCPQRSGLPFHGIDYSLMPLLRNNLANNTGRLTNDGVLISNNRGLLSLSRYCSIKHRDDSDEHRDDSLQERSNCIISKVNTNNRDHTVHVMDKFAVNGVHTRHHRDRLLSHREPPDNNRVPYERQPNCEKLASRPLSRKGRMADSRSLDNRHGDQTVAEQSGKGNSDDVCRISLYNEDDSYSTLEDNNMMTPHRICDDIPELDLIDYEDDGGDSLIESSDIDYDNRHMRIFIALFDYDPSTMSPNPAAIDEELPFKEGQLIKVHSCFIPLKIV